MMAAKCNSNSGTSTRGGGDEGGPNPNQFIGCVVLMKKKLSQIEKMGRKADDQFDSVIGRVRQILTNKDGDSNSNMLVLEHAKVNNVSVPDGYTVKSGYIIDLEVVDLEVGFVGSDNDVNSTSNNLNSKTSMPIAVPGSKSKSKQNHQQLENNRKTNGSLPSYEAAMKKSQSPKVIYTASTFEDFVVKCQTVSPQLHIVQKQEFQKLSTASNPYSILMDIHTAADKKKDEIDSTTTTATTTGSSLLSGFGQSGAGAFKCVQPKNMKNNMNPHSPNQMQKSNQSSSINNNNNNNQQNSRKHNHHNNEDKTFSMMSTNDIQNAGEFDFEENNMQFEKLPVERKDKGDSYALDVHRQASKPKGINSPKNLIEAHKILEKKLLSKNPNEHTTLKNERKIESIKISLESNKGEEGYNFITDQGILIPTVNLYCRKALLNTSHSAGLTYEKLVEVFGRAISQIAIQLSCEAYRLSPERPDSDRPKVLIAVNYHSHWQANSALCAARILSTLGVKTFVILYPVDNLCDDASLARVEKEENLYKLTGNQIYFSEHELIADLKHSSESDQNISFDLFINGTNTLSPEPFAHFSIGSLNQILIDYDGTKPDDYDSPTDNLTTNARTYLVASCLPLDVHFEILRNSTNEGNKSIGGSGGGAGHFCKYFLVNLGIPLKIFSQNQIIYKSPFADRLCIQLFLPKKTK